MTRQKHELPEQDLKVGKVTSRRIYTGQVVSLDVDRVRFPNGTVGELEMVRHSGASAVLPLMETPDEESRVILIRQYRYAAEGFVYEIPAGRLEANETPEECARRELKEETGYAAEKLIPLTTIFTTPGFTDERIHLFLATGLIPGSATLEPDEILQLCPTPLSLALEMIWLGEIQDGKTISALLFANLFSNRVNP